MWRPVLPVTGKRPRAASWRNTLSRARQQLLDTVVVIVGLRDGGVRSWWRVYSRVAGVSLDGGRGEGTSLSALVLPPATRQQPLYGGGGAHEKADSFSRSTVVPSAPAWWVGVGCRIIVYRTLSLWKVTVDVVIVACGDGGCRRCACALYSAHPRKTVATVSSVSSPSWSYALGFLRHHRAFSTRTYNPPPQLY